MKECVMVRWLIILLWVCTAARAQELARAFDLQVVTFRERKMRLCE